MPDPGNNGVCSFLSAQVRPGMVVLDVGANAGVITELAAALVGRRGRVIAFEPGPDSAAALERRFRNHPHVRVRRQAVSDASGAAGLHLDVDSSQRHSLFAPLVGVPGGTVPVEIVRLDDLFESLPRVDVIKIDAQGADGRVLAGARRILMRDHPLIVFELWPAGLIAAGTPPALVFDHLALLGYRCVRLSVKGQPKSAAALAEFLERPASKWESTNVVAWPPGWPVPARRTQAFDPVVAFRRLRAGLMRVRLRWRRAVQ